ncbi:hypothetical protein [Kamptonema sp. UHCC 0994]|nr:hypothetical protein [Kamptonema sp. UHCC 0994]MDF0552430.1 hypothetical protein [Kamptonema sp. UHCC 0994]
MSAHSKSYSVYLCQDLCTFYVTPPSWRFLYRQDGGVTDSFV